MAEERKVGRPTLCTPAVVDELIDALQTGMSIKGACNCAGISTETYYDWLSRGETGQQPFADFLTRATQARGKGERALVTAMSTDTGRAFVLRSTYGYKDQPVEVVHSGRIDLATMTPEQIEARARELAAEIAAELAKP